jgi:pyruvate dehydrogenase E2 component (dihydrolipoamide acetyltransferase)
MSTEIKMPQLGETVVEGTITKWLKQEGEKIEADDYLVEISTDKVDSEVPSSASGVLQKILVQEGETVSVGTPIAIIGEEGAAAGGEEAAAEQPEAKAEEEPAAAVEKEKEELPEKPAAEAQPTDEPKAEEPKAEAPEEPEREEPQQPGPTAKDTAKDTSKRGIISPLVRRLADEHDVNLDELEGTGTGGRIRKQDVLKFVEQRKARPAARPAASAEPAPKEEAAEPAAAAGRREELVPWSNIRRRTAEHMVASHLETARAWNAVEVDWSNVVELRARAKDAFKAKEGFGLTYMPFLARALCETLLEIPEVNASFDEANQANLIKHYVNLGIAVALEGGGLIVPVVKDADEKNLVGLARAVNDVATRARTKKLSPDDIVGGTFTITNPGPFGSIMSVPIIPKGQTAILAFEAIQKRVVVTKDDAIAIRSMGFLPMSWDHRVIDGAEAARFLARLRERIETTDFSTELSQYI